MKRALCVWFPGRSSPTSNEPGLETLADWCQRYTPFVSIESDSLILDVTGDEQALLQQVRHDFRCRRMAVRLGLADTPGAAWAVAHFGTTRIIARGQTDALLPLPVAALRLTPSAVAALQAFDIRRISQLAALPRSSLLRFGPEILQRLEQAFGNQPELLTPVHRPQPIQAVFTFDDPPDRSALEVVLGRLVHKLSEQTTGITGVHVELNCGRSVDFEVGMIVPAAPAHVSELITARLERITFPGALQSVRLTVTSTMADRQPLLFGGQDFSRLIDRLCNRLGNQRVTRPRLLPEAQPELAVQWEAVASPDMQPAPLAKLPRPLWLLTPEPIQVEWDTRFLRGSRAYAIVGYWGPERIETGWWRHRDIRRDYFRVETNYGRFWLFRRVTEGDWFLHGEFD